MTTLDPAANVTLPTHWSVDVQDGTIPYADEPDALVPAGTYLFGRTDSDDPETAWTVCLRVEYAVDADDERGSTTCDVVQAIAARLNDHARASAPTGPGQAAHEVGVGRGLRPPIGSGVAAPTGPGQGGDVAALRDLAESMESVAMGFAGMSNTPQHGPPIAAWAQQLRDVTDRLAAPSAPGGAADPPLQSLDDLVVAVETALSSAEITVEVREDDGTTAPLRRLVRCLRSHGVLDERAPNPAPGEAAETEGGDDLTEAADRLVTADAQARKPGDWLTEELRRARDRFEKLPRGARPVVTRPVEAQRSEAPSPAPAEPESDTAGGTVRDVVDGERVDEAVRAVTAQSDQPVAFRAVRAVLDMPRDTSYEFTAPLLARKIDEVYGAVGVDLDTPWADVLARIASPPPGRPAETGETAGGDFDVQAPPADTRPDAVLATALGRVGAAATVDEALDLCHRVTRELDRYDMVVAARPDLAVNTPGLGTSPSDRRRVYRAIRNLLDEDRAGLPPDSADFVVQLVARAMNRTLAAPQESTAEGGEHEQWRIGRRNPHTVYRQRGGEPRGYEHDESLGYFRHPEDAQRAVDAVNATSPRPVPADTEGGCTDPHPLFVTREEWCDGYGACQSSTPRAASGAAVPDGAPAPGALIETVDELDRLPVGVTVALADGDVGKRYAPGWAWISGPVTGYSLPARVLDAPGAPSPLAEAATLLDCTPDQVPARVRGLLDEQRGGET